MDVLLGFTQWKPPQTLSWYYPLHFPISKFSRCPGNYSIVPQLLCHCPHITVSTMMMMMVYTAFVPCSFSSVRAVTPAFGRLAAIEARLEGEYRRGVGRVGRESEQVAWVPLSCNSSYREMDQKQKVLWWWWARKGYPQSGLPSIDQTRQFYLQGNTRLGLRHPASAHCIWSGSQYIRYVLPTNGRRIMWSSICGPQLDMV